MSSVANEISGKAFDTQDISPEFNQNANSDISQENAGQEGVSDGNQQGERSDEGIQGTTEAFNSVAPPQPSMDNSRMEELEDRYAHLKEDSLGNSQEQSQQLDSNELSHEQSELQENYLQEPENNYDRDDGLSL